MTDHQPKNIAELVDRMGHHRDTYDEALERALPEQLAEQVRQTSNLTRSALGVDRDNLAVLFGEQTYGPGPLKVLGKRLLGTAARNYAGVVRVELMASSDAVGSEPDLRAFKLPNTQHKLGHSVINLLPGWRKIAFRATDAVDSPTVAHVKTIRDAAYNLYNRGVAAPFLDRLEATYVAIPDNYAAANTQILRDYESKLGIDGDVLVHDGDVDTFIAQNGGLDVILALWPSFLAAARRHAVDGVRIPNQHEAPFYLYHDCGGRMEVSIASADSAITGHETNLATKCLDCNHQENTTVGDVLASGRRLAFRAMARVTAYSLFGLGDGHITGGGSVYNAPTAGAFRELGLPYFPIIHMSKTNDEGERTGVIEYSSGALAKKKAETQQGFQAASELVREGGVSMADLEISTNPDVVRDAIAIAMHKPGAFGPHSRVRVPKNEEQNGT
jgi:hypothetical protein